MFRNSEFPVMSHTSESTLSDVYLWYMWLKKSRNVQGDKYVKMYIKIYLIRKVFICFRHSFRTCSLKSPSICAATWRFCSNIWQTVEYTNIVSDQEGLQSLIIFFSLFHNNKSVIIAVILGFSTLSVGGLWVICEFVRSLRWNTCHILQWLSVHKSIQMEIHKKCCQVES